MDFEERTSVGLYLETAGSKLTSLSFGMKTDNIFLTSTVFHTVASTY